MRAYERLLHYITFLTPSDENCSETPSSKCQFALAEELARELRDLGVEDATSDEHCYVYGHLPATEGYEDCTPIGFIAHMDTVADFCDHVPNPQIIENYDGKAVALGESGLVLDPATFPHLEKLKGRTLITTDGTTILGADDKAGIAEIMTLVEELKDQPHGPISVGFTPDEEIGNGTAFFDVAGFGAKYAYTLDGDLENEIQYETFNAASAKVAVHGENVHPGSAKNAMLNASLIAMEFDALLPAAERAERTEGYEGFYHLTQMEGTVSDASLTYIIRDHDRTKLEHRLETMKQAAKFLNERYGEGRIELTLVDQYHNMAEVLKEHPETIEKAKAAIVAAGLEPNTAPVRGGTDGAVLSFKGLPCPNFGTGGNCFHGPYEHITVEGMDKAVEIMHNLVKEYMH